MRYNSYFYYILQTDAKKKYVIDIFLLMIACKIIILNEILKEWFDQLLLSGCERSDVDEEGSNITYIIGYRSGKAQRRAIEYHLTEKGKHCVPTCVCAYVCARHKCGWRAQHDPMHGCIRERGVLHVGIVLYKMRCYLPIQSCYC